MNVRLRRTTPHPPIPAPNTGTLPTERGIPFALSQIR